MTIATIKHARRRRRELDSEPCPSSPSKKAVADLLLTFERLSRSELAAKAAHYDHVPDIAIAIMGELVADGLFEHDGPDAWDRTAVEYRPERRSRRARTNEGRPPGPGIRNSETAGIRYSGGNGIRYSASARTDTRTSSIKPGAASPEPPNGGAPTPAPRSGHDERSEESHAPPPSNLGPGPGASGATASAVTAICSPHADGGVTLVLEAPRSAWAPALRALATARREGQLAELITPIDGEHLRVVVRRHRGRLEPVSVDDGTVVHPILGGEHNGPDRIRIIAPRRALWLESLDVWMARWVDRISQLALGVSCPDVSQAKALGWRVDRVDVCVDYAVPNALVTASDFTSFRYRGKHVPMVPEPTRRGDDLAAIHRRDHGSRGADLSLSVQRKNVVVRELDGCKPSESIYARTWRDHGWNGSDEIVRVEFRARRRALARKHLDMTDPANLTADNLERLFADAMTRYALVSRDGTIDPRWLALRDAAAVVDTDLGPSLPISRPLPSAMLAVHRRGVLLGAAARFVSSIDPNATPEDVLDVAVLFADQAHQRAALALARARCNNGR